MRNEVPLSGNTPSDEFRPVGRMSKRPEEALESENKTPSGR